MTQNIGLKLLYVYSSSITTHKFKLLMVQTWYFCNGSVCFMFWCRIFVLLAIFICIFIYSVKFGNSAFTIVMECYIKHRLFLNLKFGTSSLLQCLYRPVCARPGRIPKLLVFSHEATYNSTHNGNVRCSILK